MHYILKATGVESPDELIKLLQNYENNNFKQL